MPPRGSTRGSDTSVNVLDGCIHSSADCVADQMLSECINVICPVGCWHRDRHSVDLKKIQIHQLMLGRTIVFFAKAI